MIDNNFFISEKNKAVNIMTKVNAKKKLTHCFV